MLRYQEAIDLYVGEYIAVRGETFTNALGVLVEDGHDPAAAVDLLMRESTWSYPRAGVFELRRCLVCGTVLDSGTPLGYCNVICHAAGLAGRAWQGED